MTVLGIETATSVCGVAVANEGGILAERILNTGTQHAERLLPAIRDALGEAGVPARDLGGIAVSIGPGSFTGLRIGLSTAKALCWADGVPIVPVSTLEAFASRFPFASAPVCPTLDARKREVYAGLYDTSSGVAVARRTPSALPPRALLDSLTGPVLFAGDGARLYRSEILEAMGPRARFAPAFLDAPSAGSVAELGLRALLRGESADPVALEPVYLRKSEAELRHGG